MQIGVGLLGRLRARGLDIASAPDSHPLAPSDLGVLSLTLMVPGKKGEILVTTSFEVVMNFSVFLSQHLARCTKHFGESVSGLVSKISLFEGGLGERGEGVE